MTEGQSAFDGIDTAVVHPVYLDHWIPRPAPGGLGRAILDYESEMSRRLNWASLPAALFRGGQSPLHVE